MHSTLSVGTRLTGMITRFSSAFVTLQPKISVVITLMFIASSAWILGQLVWQVQEGHSSVTVWRANSPQGSLSTNDQPSDISEILNANLFGLYSEKVIPIEKPIVKDAPKTKLNLVLVGAVSSSDNVNSLAVIANRGSQATYGIGERIEGTQVKLKAVFIDRVIIDNTGRDETLMLEGIEYSKRAIENRSPTSNVKGGGGIGNNASAPLDQLSEIRNQILEDPQNVLRYIRLSQVKKDNRLIGYRVRPGSQRALFDSIGLQDGDIAIQLNGEDLTDPASMGKVWQSISELTELNLTVDRDGQNHEIYIAF